MLFNSWQFAVFLPIVFALYWSLPPKWRTVFLLIASYYFYMCWNMKYVLLILAVTLVAYITGIFAEKNGNIKLTLIVFLFGLVFCFGMLFLFKYFNFFYSTVTAVLGRFLIKLSPYTIKLILPVGISFYTFQAVSYMIDVHNGKIKAEKNFIVFATYISFFPQLVAGPIERTENLLPQIKSPHYFDYDKATYGLKLMAWGFFKKIVIADNLAVYADKVFNSPFEFSGFALLLAALFFTVQIYCDFSGYSDIAIGTASLLGIRLMKNFNSPYFSTSVRDFWNRWHISLSTWLRDYVYIPLGGNRVGKIRHYFNLIVTFFVSGLWHGANWTFIVWGMIHGFAQVIENSMGLSKTCHKSALIKYLQTILVFMFVCLAWVFFRANSLTDAVYILKNMFWGLSSPLIYLKNGFTAIGMGKKNLLICVLFYILPLGLYDYFSQYFDVIDIISEMKSIYRWIIYTVFSVLVFLLMYSSVNQSFIYFQF